MRHQTKTEMRLADYSKPIFPLNDGERQKFKDHMKNWQHKFKNLLFPGVSFPFSLLLLLIE